MTTANLAIMKALEGAFVSPQPFSGLSSEREANYNSHDFRTYGYDYVYCERCDATPHGELAFYECGTDGYPTVVTALYSDGSEERHLVPSGTDLWGFIDQLPTRKDSK